MCILEIPTSSSHLDAIKTAPTPTVEIKANSDLHNWPPVADQDMEATVCAFLTMSDMRVPRPFSDWAQAELKEQVSYPKTYRDNLLNFPGLCEESVQRLRQDAELALRLLLDLGDIPLIETREELTVEQMAAFAKSSVNALTQNVKDIKPIMDDLSVIANLGGKIFQVGRENYEEEEIGSWSKASIDVLQKHGISLAPSGTSAKLYEKLSLVWGAVEKSLVRSSLRWLQSLLETQRLKFYSEVGQHLSDEATLLAHLAMGKFRENDDSSLVTDLLAVARSPFLLEWPILLQPPNNK